MSTSFVYVSGDDDTGLVTIKTPVENQGTMKQDQQILEEMEEKVKHLVENEKFKETIPLVEMIIKTKTSTLGEMHSQTLRFRYKLGLYYKKQNEFQQAIEILEDVETKQTETLGANDEETFITR